MIRLVLKQPGESYSVAKRYVNVNNGNDLVTEAVIERKRYEEKPAQSKNSVVRKIHKFVYYGLAAC